MKLPQDPPQLKRMIRLDTMALRSDAIERAITAAEHSGVGVAILVGASIESVDRTLSILARIPATILRTGQQRPDSSCESFAPQVPTCALVLKEIIPGVRLLPSSARLTVGLIWAGMLDQREIAKHLDELATSRRTLERALRRVGFKSLASHRKAAQLSSSWDLLDDERLSLSRIAERSGFSCDRTLTLGYRALLGLPPRRARRDLTTANIVERLVEALQWKGGHP